MANILILGAGVMGSALAITAVTHKSNNVSLIGSPLDNDIVSSIRRDHWHPTLKADIPNTISVFTEAELTDVQAREADIIVIGVSSPGVEWAVNAIKKNNAKPMCVALVTKGLVATEGSDSAPLTYADALSSDFSDNNLLGIGGPCIARELAMGMPTAVTFAARDLDLAKRVREIFQTDYYRVATHPDFVGLEACAALKNFYCIGVSAMLGAWAIEKVTAKNPVAALFNQAVLEMGLVCQWIRDATDTAALQQNRSGLHEVAFDLPGMGDLHVTVGGGRNSRLGTHLGQGQRLSEIVNGSMKGVTVEGLDTGRQLLGGFNTAINTGALIAKQLPLTKAILDTIEADSLFRFDFKNIPVSYD